MPAALGSYDVYIPPFGPIIVWVFPAAVWPYAMRVPLYPFMKSITKRRAMRSYAFAWLHATGSTPS